MSATASRQAVTAFKDMLYPLVPQPAISQHHSICGAGLVEAIQIGRQLFPEVDASQREVFQCAGFSIRRPM